MRTHHQLAELQADRHVLTPECPCQPLVRVCGPGERQVEHQTLPPRTTAHSRGCLTVGTGRTSCRGCTCRCHGETLRIT